MSLIARATPAASARTPDSGVVRVAAEGRASRAVARALGALVDRLMALGPDRADVLEAPPAVDKPDAALAQAREALRHLAARSRDGVMLCRLVNDTLVLEGVPIDRQATLTDPMLAVLLRRLVALQVGSVTIREGAAPAELLQLARLLAQPPGTPLAPAAADGSRSTPIGGSTPGAVRPVASPHEAPVELLRTWSVLVTPVAPERVAEAAASAPGSALARLSAARTDDAATGAVAALSELLDEAQRRGDAAAVEGIARACMMQLQAAGESGGRLALETLVRRLQRAPILDLLARQLPYRSDRTLLLQLFARAGDAGVDVLVHHLMTTDDSLGRRAYFDSIVDMDVGSVRLFDALRDSRWYVVRNAAALLAEMGVAHADVELIPLLHDADERLRVAAARALMRLRTVKSLQALHGSIDDSNTEVRRLSASAFGLAGAIVGGGVRPPSARLAAALEVETDEDVALEMLAALGRLGSADAVQRLIRIAMPATVDTAGMPVGETREAWVRIAALEALVRARGAQIEPLIAELTCDADAEVAAAAAALKVAGPLN